MRFPCIELVLHRESPQEEGGPPLFRGLHRPRRRRLGSWQAFRVLKVWRSLREKIRRLRSCLLINITLASFIAAYQILPGIVLNWKFEIAVELGNDVE